MRKKPSNSLPSLHFAEHGGTGPYLLLVHGFLSSSAQWKLNLPTLRKICRPITVDLWGHGQSPAPEARSHYSPSSYALEFEKIRKELGTENWFICGYSIGASLSIRYAIDFSRSILGHAFTNSTSAFTDYSNNQVWLASIAENAAKISAGGLEAIEKIPVHPKRARNIPKSIHNELLRASKDLNPIAIANTYLETLVSANIMGVVKHNVRPALMLWGTKEKRFQKLGEWAKKNIPLLQVVKLDTGHGVNMEKADDFDKTTFISITAAGKFIFSILSSFVSSAKAL